MDTEKLRTIVGQTIEKIEIKKADRVNNSFICLAELLVVWYSR